MISYKSSGKYVPVSENPKKEPQLKIFCENYYNYDEKSFFEALDIVCRWKLGES